MSHEAGSKSLKWAEALRMDTASPATRKTNRTEYLIEFTPLLPDMSLPQPNALHRGTAQAAWSRNAITSSTMVQEPSPIARSWLGNRASIVGSFGGLMSYLGGVPADERDFPALLDIKAAFGFIPELLSRSDAPARPDRFRGG